MTQESIQTRYTLDPALASATELEQAIAQAIMKDIHEKGT